MRYHFYQSWPLRVQITVAMLFLSSLLAISIGEYVHRANESFLNNSIEENKTQLLEIIASTAIEPMITEDIPVLITIVNQLASINSDLVSLQLQNEDAIVLASWEKPAVSDHEYFMNHYEPIVYEGEIFGYIQIKWDLSEKYAVIHNHINGVYLLIAIILFLFTVITILGLHYLVTLPIRDIEHRLINHSEGRDDSKDKIKTSQEFESLYATVEKIRDLTTSKEKLLQEVSQRKAIQEELAIARDKALSATKAKSEFLANMSHEIRTPLTAIIGFSETLLDSDQGMVERVEAIKTIIRSGHHLKSLINDILDLSKIEAGKLDIVYSDTDLIRMICDVHALSELQAEGKGLYCKLIPRLPLPRIICTDPLRLKQVLINLCSNAIKFTEKGGIKLEITYQQDANKLQFKVIDSGIGMTPEQQEKIFRPFTQADGSTTRKFGGTGLGLYLSKTLVAQMHGSLTVDSTRDIGSCFTITLPIELDTEDNLLHELPNDQQLSLSHTLPSLKGTVLLAEDSPENQKLISFMLEKTGLECDIANNGNEAVNMALEKNYDLILMDMQMPVMGGVDATISLRKQNYQGTITALTANATTEDRAYCMANGFDDFLTKPIDRKQFYAYLESQLSEDNSQHSTAIDPIISSLANDPIIGKLLPEYIQGLPGIVAEIVDASEKQELEILRGFVHDLKSTSGSHGYMQLYEKAVKLEFEIAKADHEGIKRRVNQIVNIKDRICQMA